MDRMDNSDRTCGTCNACCTWLGIDAPGLHKRAGVRCRHLSTNRRENCCNIYARRPESCVKYRCGWLQGVFDNDLRPDKSGVVVSFYMNEDMGDCELSPQIQAIYENMSHQLTVTVTVIDEDKARGFRDGDPLKRIVFRLTDDGINDIRIVNHKSKKVLHFLAGNIYEGDLLHADTIEGLAFQTYDPPVGKYIVREIPHANRT